MLGSWMRLKFPLCALCQPAKPLCFSFSAQVGVSLVAVASFARPREEQNSSLATGYTVAVVASVGFLN